MSEAKQIPTMDAIQSVARNLRTLLSHELYQYGLYAGQDRVILALSFEDGLSLGTLAKMLGIKPPTITKTVTRLQEKGFVMKRVSDIDQRQMHVYLTPRGYQAVDLIKKSIQDTEIAALENFSNIECETLIAMCSRLDVNLNGKLSTMKKIDFAD